MERDRLDLVLRNVPNPIIVVDNTNQIVSLNAAAERLFKPPRDPLVQSRRTQVAMRNDAKFTSFLAQLSLDPAPRRSGELRHRSLAPESGGKCRRRARWPPACRQDSGRC